MPFHRARIRRRLGAVASAAAVLATVLTTSGTPALAAAAVTAPTQDQAWRTGDTRNITWTADGQSGAFTVELWKATERLATLGTGADVTAGTFRWTIPNWMPELVVEDVQIKIVPAVGDTITSASFDLRKPDIGGIMVCWHEVHLQYAPQVCVPNFEWFSTWNGDTVYLAWGSNGITGPEVKIDVIQVEGATTTVIPVLKKTPNDGREYIKIPAKVKDSGWFSSVNSYIRITPVLATAAAGTSGETPIFLLGGTTPWQVELMDPFDVTATAGDVRHLDVRFPENDDDREYVIGATSSTGLDVEIYRGPSPRHPFFRWAAPTPGTWTFYATTGEGKGKGKRYTSTRKLIATANDDVVRQDDPSDATAGSGQPITINWGFFDDDADTSASEDFPGVDITVVNAAGKVVEKVAQNLTVDVVEDRDQMHPEMFDLDFNTGSTIWRPAAKLPAGTYTIRVARSGSTTASTKTVTVAHPTSVTATWTARDLEPGEKIDVSWALDNDAKVPVDIVITTGTGKDAKTISLGKKIDATSANVMIPFNAAPGSYKLFVRTSDKFGTAKASLASTGITFNVVAPTITTTGASTVAAGASYTVNWSYGKGSTAPVKLELFKGSGTKPVETISKSATGGSFVWQVPSDLPAGTDYFVRATSIGPKPAATDDSPAIAVTVPTVTVTDSVYASGVTMGESVTTTWTATGSTDLVVGVSLLKGTKVVAKLAAKVTTVDGSGQFQWVVPTKLTAGDDYTVRVTDGALATITDASATFTVRANSTVLD